MFKWNVCNFILFFSENDGLHSIVAQDSERNARFRVNNLLIGNAWNKTMAFINKIWTQIIV